MMPGEDRSKIGATIGACQNCTVLHESLKEYVAAFVTLKQKIIDSDHLVNEYHEKCDELQRSQRETAKLHAQLDELRLKIVPLEKRSTDYEALQMEVEKRGADYQALKTEVEKQSADYEALKTEVEKRNTENGALQAELEQKRDAVKAYHQMSAEVDRLKEENTIALALRKALEDKLEEAEEMMEKQSLDNAHLQIEKASLENQTLQAQAAMRRCQKVADQVDSLRQENAKILIIKKNLENHLKVLEESNLEQNHQISELKGEKNQLEINLQDNKLRLQKLEREKNKALRNTSTQASAPVSPKVDKEKFQQLLLDLWTCVEPVSSQTTPALNLPETTSQVFATTVKDGCLPTISTSEKSQQAVMGIADIDLSLNVFQSTSTSPLKPSSIQTKESLLQSSGESPQGSGKLNEKEGRKKRQSQKLFGDNPPVEEHPVGRENLAVEENPAVVVDRIVGNQANKRDLPCKESKRNGKDVKAILDWFKPLPPALSPMPFSPAESGCVDDPAESEEKVSVPLQCSLSPSTVPETTKLQNSSESSLLHTTDSALKRGLNWMQSSQCENHVLTDSISSEKTTVSLNGGATTDLSGSKSLSDKERMDLDPAGETIQSSTKETLPVPDNLLFVTNVKKSQLKSIDSRSHVLDSKSTLRHTRGEDPKITVQNGFETDTSHGARFPNVKNGPNEDENLSGECVLKIASDHRDSQPNNHTLTVISSGERNVTDERKNQNTSNITSVEGIQLSSEILSECLPLQMQNGVSVCDVSNHEVKENNDGIVKGEYHCTNDNEVSKTLVTENGKSVMLLPFSTDEWSAEDIKVPVSVETNNVATVQTNNTSPTVSPSDTPTNQIMKEEPGSRYLSGAGDSAVEQKGPLSGALGTTSLLQNEQTGRTTPQSLEPQSKDKHILCKTTMEMIDVDHMTDGAQNGILLQSCGSIETSISNEKSASQDQHGDKTMGGLNVGITNILKEHSNRKWPQKAVALCKDELENTPEISEPAETVPTTSPYRPDVLGRVRTAMGPPLRPLLLPLLTTPPRNVRPAIPRQAIGRLSFPSPMTEVGPPGQETPPVQSCSERPTDGSQLYSPSLNTPPPCNGVPSSPLQFGSATPKHALPVPGRLPSATMSSTPPSSSPSQDSSMRILDTMYPELSARARTLSILRGNVNLGGVSAAENGTTSSSSVSQISGFKSIDSPPTAFTNTELRGKRAGVNAALPKSAKRLRLDTCSPSPAAKTSATTTCTDGSSPADEDPSEEPTHTDTACSERKRDGSMSVSQALLKIEAKCFDLLPVIRSHLLVGNLSKKPVLRDEEKEVLTQFSRHDQSSSEDMMSTILTKLKAERDVQDGNHLQALCRVYTGMCRQRRDWERAHILAYSILKEDFPDAEKLILFMATTWRDVFSHSSAVCQAIHTVSRLRAQGELLNCLSAYLGWEKNPPGDLDQLISSTLSAIRTPLEMAFQKHARRGEDLNARAWDQVFSLDLLCKHKKWDWTQSNVLSKELWPMMNTWVTQSRSQQSPMQDVSVATVLRLIGRLGQLGMEANCSASVATVANVINTFGRHGESEGVPWAVQLAAVYAVYDLSPVNPKEALQALAGWRGDATRPVPPAVISCINQIAFMCRQAKI